MLWLVTLLLGSGLAVASGEGVNEAAQPGYHFGVHEPGVRAWLLAGVRERKFGKGSQPGFTAGNDVRHRRGTRMLVAK